VDVNGVSVKERRAANDSTQPDGDKSAITLVSQQTADNGLGVLERGGHATRWTESTACVLVCPEEAKIEDLHFHDLRHTFAATGLYQLIRE
jgi:integrase